MVEFFDCAVRMFNDELTVFIDIAQGSAIALVLSQYEGLHPYGGLEQLLHGHHMRLPLGFVLPSMYRLLWSAKIIKAVSTSPFFSLCKCKIFACALFFEKGPFILMDKKSISKCNFC